MGDDTKRNEWKDKQYVSSEIQYNATVQWYSTMIQYNDTVHVDRNSMHKVIALPVLHANITTISHRINITVHQKHSTTSLSSYQPSKTVKTIRHPPVHEWISKMELFLCVLILAAFSGCDDVCLVRLYICNHWPVLGHSQENRHTHSYRAMRRLCCEDNGDTTSTFENC